MNNDPISQIQVSQKHVSSIEVRDESRALKVIKSTTFWILVVVVVMVVAFGVLTPNHVFFLPSTLLTVAFNGSQMMIVAVGMAYLLGAGELDLSVGTNIILSSTLAAKALKAFAGTPEQIMRGEYTHLTAGIIVGVLVAILSGSLFGLLNGLIVTRLRINSFIATLGTMMMYWGTALVLSQGAAEVGIPRALQTGFGHKKLLGIVPLPLLVAVAIGLILWVIIATTRFGLHTLAIGSSKESARRSGIDIDAHRLKLFILLGGLAGLAGLFDLVRFATTNPAGHQTDALLAITAAVLGGTSMWGGIAAIGGAMLGTLIPVILQTGLVIMEIGAFYQLIGTGILLIGAVYMDQRKRGRDAEA